MPIIQGPEFAITRDLSAAEKELGVDLSLNKDGDLQLNNLNDFELLAGARNAAQAAKLKLQIEPGGLVYHPAIGTDLRIGEKTKNAFDIQTQILRSLAQDPRFEDIDVKVQVSGNTVIVTLFLTLANTGVSVPLQFVSVEGRI